MTDRGSAASSSSKATLGANLFINIVMQGSLKQVWAMVEPMQVVVHMSLFACKLPGNVIIFNEYFAKIANFEFVDPNELTEEISYVPEIEPVNLNF